MERCGIQHEVASYQLCKDVFVFVQAWINRSRWMIADNVFYNPYFPGFGRSNAFDSVLIVRTYVNRHLCPLFLPPAKTGGDGKSGKNTDAPWRFLMHKEL